MALSVPGTGHRPQDIATDVCFRVSAKPPASTRHTVNTEKRRRLKPPFHCESVSLNEENAETEEGLARSRGPLPLLRRVR
jgi:hypothetical protein